MMSMADYPDMRIKRAAGTVERRIFMTEHNPFEYLRLLISNCSSIAHDSQNGLTFFDISLFS